ncbi:MAG: hypothetical protein Q7S33_03370 [Nanoarchaeota archaeon]|nr:hypothetical protein [Nanoarchaeota archaeon]
MFNTCNLILIKMKKLQIEYKLNIRWQPEKDVLSEDNLLSKSDSDTIFINWQDCIVHEYVPSNPEALNNIKEKIWYNGRDKLNELVHYAIGHMKKDGEIIPEQMPSRIIVSVECYNNKPSFWNKFSKRLYRK